MMTTNLEIDALPADRRGMILSQLEERGSVRVSELAKKLGVTPVTIRRDLDYLQDQGIVIRVHGGVQLSKKADPHGRPPVLRPAARVQADAPVIGMVVPSLDYYWPTVARGAKERARERNVRILLRKSAYHSVEEDWKQVEHLVNEANVQALLLTINTGDAKSLDLLEWVATKEVPVVLVERQAESLSLGTPYESITSDHRAGAILAIKTLVDMKHEKIAFLSSQKSPTGPYLRQGWEDACKRFGVAPENMFFSEITNDSPEILREEAHRLLDECLSRGITGAMVHADPEANALIQQAQQRGLSLPDDLSVIAYDDELASLFTPSVTAVRPPRYSIGATAVDLIADRLEDPNRPNRRVILSPRLTIRESTGAPRTASAETQGQE